MPRIGYCLACGRLRELACGKCAQCRKDDAVRAARRGQCRNGAAMANPQGEATQGGRSQGTTRGKHPTPRLIASESMGGSSETHTEGSSS